MTKEQKKPFTKREWITLIVLLSIVQAFFWYAVFENSQSTSALAYVSFAGTLVSIILAVLAIGYTYGESLGQKNKSDNVSSQIAVLNEVVKSIKFESQSLEHISTISEELTRFSSKFEQEIIGTKESIEKVSDSLGSLISNNDNYLPINPIEYSREIDKKEMAKLFMRARSPFMEITVLFIIAAKGKSYFTTNEMVKDNVNRYIDITLENFRDRGKVIKDWDDITELFTGAFFSTISILQGFNLISGDVTKEIAVSDALIDEVKRTTLVEPIDSGDFYTEIRNEVVKDIKASIQTPKH